MRDLNMIHEQLNGYIEQMKNKEIEPKDFFQGIMKILAQIDVTNDDLKGVTPQLLGFINGLIRNMEKNA